MNFLKKTIKKIAIVAAGITAVGNSMVSAESAPFPITPTTDGKILVSKLFDENVTVENVTFNGQGSNGAYFSGANDIIKIENGIVLSTQTGGFSTNPSWRPMSSRDHQPVVTSATTKNGVSVQTPTSGPSQQTPPLNGEPIGDGPTSVQDTVLEFDIIPKAKKISFNAVFTSGEISRWNEGKNDSFELLVNQTNVAFLPRKYRISEEPYPLPVTAKNISEVGCYLDESDFIPRTEVMEFEAELIPNQKNHVKLVIADVEDSLVNSSIFLNGRLSDPVIEEKQKNNDVVEKTETKESEEKIENEVVENPKTGDMNLLNITVSTLASLCGLVIFTKKRKEI